MVIQSQKNLSFNKKTTRFTTQSFKIKKEIDVQVFLMYYADFSVDEFTELLTSEERERVCSFKSMKRKREFMAVRLLKSEVFGSKNILYSPIGAPYIIGEGCISIAHAKNVVGIACGETSIGFDLEPIDEKVQRVKQKFLSKQERACFDEHSTKDLIKIWSAKEALYKLSSERGLIFSENLILYQQEEDLIFGVIKTKKQHKSVILFTKIINDFVMSVNVSPLKEVKQ